MQPSGHAIVVGRYDSNYPFGASPNEYKTPTLMSFLAKYDPDGNVVWLKDLGSTNSNSFGFITGVTSDATGNISICGHHSTQFSLGETNLTVTTNTRAFFAKYNSDGRLLYAMQSEDQRTAYCYGTSVDDAGNQYVSGAFYGTLVLGSTNIHADSSGRGGYVAKFDNSGALKWLYHLTNFSSGFDGVFGTDTAGNVFAAGRAVSGSYYTSLTKLNTTGSRLRYNEEPNSILLSWSALAEGFELERAFDTAPTHWTPIPASEVITNAISNLVTVPKSEQRQFFRLRRP